MNEPRIVAGTAAASVSGVPGLAKRVQDAMSQAVKDCMAEGINDPAKIRARMLEYRERATSTRSA